MATVTFTYPEDVSRFPKPTQHVITMLHDLGWTLRWQGTNKNVVTARADDGYTFNLPRTNINANRMKSWVKQVERHSDPERFAEWVEDNTTPEQKPAPAPSPATAHAPMPDTAVAAAMREAAEKAVDTLRPAAEAVVVSRTRDTEPQSTQEASMDEQFGTRHVVMEKPWLARRGSGGSRAGRVYESPHVIERHWSDGSTDFRCRWCPYTNTAGRSVATHARVHPERKVPQPAGRRITDYEPSEIKHSQSAVRRLSSDLLHALDTIPDWQGRTREDLAHLLAERVYDERPDREPAEPLTPEQIIARIVTLVDMGRLADLHQKVEDLAARLSEAEEARERAIRQYAEAQREAERLHEERRVLRDLLSESEAS